MRGWVQARPLGWAGVWVGFGWHHCTPWIKADPSVAPPAAAWPSPPPAARGSPPRTPRRHGTTPPPNPHTPLVGSDLCMRKHRARPQSERKRGGGVGVPLKTYCSQNSKFKRHTCQKSVQLHANHRPEVSVPEPRGGGGDRAEGNLNLKMRAL